MRLSGLIFLMLFICLHGSLAQEVQAENLKQKHVKKIRTQDQIPEIEDHLLYVCQRCGTENQVDWSPTLKHVELIPHCAFCGKKYWPKFKPSDFLQRTFCQVADRRRPD